MPPIRGLHLVDQADRLAGRGAGPGRPKDIDLRRAVSAAYYGVFHATTGFVAQQLAEKQSEADRSQLRRTVSHTGLRNVGEAFSLLLFLRGQ